MNEVEQIIHDAIVYGIERKYGVKTVIKDSGEIHTNYPKFVVYFKQHGFTNEHKKFALKVIKESYQL